MKHYSLLACFLLTFNSFSQQYFSQLTRKAADTLAYGDLNAAKDYLQLAVNNIPPNLPDEKRAELYNNLGVVYYETGWYRKGLYFSEKALRAFQRTGKDSLVGTLKFNLGLNYKELGAYGKATQYILDAASIFEREQKESELSAAFNTLGNIARDEGDFRRAIDYHKRSLTLRISIDYSKGIADSYHNLGSVYLDMKQYSLAESHLLKALEQKKQLHNQVNLMNTFAALGKLYTRTGEASKAMYFIRKGYNLREEAGNLPKTAYSLLDLAALCDSLSMSGEAIELYQKTSEIASSTDNAELLSQALSGLIKISERKNATQDLTRLYRQLVSAMETATEEKATKEVLAQEIEYDSKLNKSAAMVQQKQAEINRLRSLQLGAFAMVLLITVLLVSRSRRQALRRKREAEKQRDYNKFLHYELSHRTKNHLSILSYILELKKQKIGDSAARKAYDNVITRLDILSTLQRFLSNESRMNRNVKLDSFLKEAIDLITASLLNEREFEFDHQIEPISLDYDTAMRLALSLNELICNAIEHGMNIAHLHLNVSLKVRGDLLEMHVRDNGRGMPLNQTPSKGGLNIIKLLLEPIGGSSSYRNENGCIATVRIKLEKIKTG